jgi:hypothetical protein
MANKANKSGDATACSPGDLSKEIKTTTFKNTKLNTVKLNWKEVYYTNCPLVSASNVDQELGWTASVVCSLLSMFRLTSVGPGSWG